MLRAFFTIPALLGISVAQQYSGHSYTGWDCCKPLCAMRPSTEILESRGIPKTCDASNKAFDPWSSSQVDTGCSGGIGYMCTDFQPVPVSDTLAYGFVLRFAGNDKTASNGECCKCYEVEWTSGAAQGKRMVVQVVTPGTPAGNVGGNDLMIYVPGGGGGPYDQGCRRQYGGSFNWGGSFGGFGGGRNNCEGLPSALQAGCYWRFNWAGGEVNNWNINYHQVSCPRQLTDISGCSA